MCIPTLIFFIYPCQLFQKCLSTFPFNWHFLHAFIDSFQGCYKDGTEPGTLDCRWFSAIFLFVRILTFLTSAVTMSVMYFIYGAIFFLVLLIATINIQPFKKVVHHQSTESIFLIISVLFHITFVGSTIASIHQNICYCYIIMLLLMLLSSFVPIIYISFLIGLWFVSRRRCWSIQ